MVAEGDEGALNEIRARGGDAEGGAAQRAEPDNKPEAIGATDVGQAEASPSKPEKLDLLPGAYSLSGQLDKKEGGVMPLSFKFKVEEGGTLQAEAAGEVKYSVAGVQTDGKWIVKLSFEGGKEVNLEGNIDNKKVIKGSYTATNPDFGTEGTFELIQS